MKFRMLKVMFFLIFSTRESGYFSFYQNKSFEVACDVTRPSTRLVELAMEDQAEEIIEINAICI